jgi:predicted enzyme related to lactoylglutathione lyase
MSNTIIALSIDSANAASLARFWADALGREVAPDADAQHAVVDIDPATTASVPRLVFHQVPEGKTIKNRLHLDLLTADFEPEIARLTALGATHLRDIEQNGARWTTLADPEGNEFDLISG